MKLTARAQKGMLVKIFPYGGRGSFVLDLMLTSSPSMKSCSSWKNQIDNSYFMQRICLTFEIRGWLSGREKASKIQTKQ